jgi:hypothetical protein
MMAVIRETIDDEVIEFMLSQPTLEAIANFRLSTDSEQRVNYLLEMNRRGTLALAEEAELNDYLRLEHIMRKAKIRAIQLLDSS